MCIQWLDNTVVSLLSTFQLSGEDVCARRSGSNILNLPVEKAMRAYQQGMSGVDRCDQYWEQGGGFASKSHYKKWYKNIHGHPRFHGDQLILHIEYVH